ncbi:MAG: acetyl-CoA carboxylase, carboxyltransferase subunit beta [Acidobacteriota bacterium]
MSWFQKEPSQKPSTARQSRVPEGLFTKCDSCRQMVFTEELLRNAKVCPQCAHHFRLSAYERIEATLDGGVFSEIDTDVAPADPLHFKDTKRYKDRLAEYQQKTGLADAIVNVTGTLGGIPVVMASMEYGFMGGSMGSVVGEKVARAAERAREMRHPLIVVSCSGGARMQEGALSLMQMAKISAALARLHRASVPYVSILTDPTTGGVTASFAMLGDLNVAEPGALIGFAGPRVIEQTIRQKLPPGFQRAEFLKEHGMLDMVVDRRRLRAALARSLEFMHGPASERTEAALLGPEGPPAHARRS